ncbi:hypothetical protein DFS34DRAFT_638633 [Phlyctochytrium arcticum]|nr:hypothetical protein DFS34DRAFT_638633 [Phlyctochytrium arcticum]
MSTNLEYKPYADHPQEKKDIINRFFDDFTLNRPELKKYILKVISSALDRHSRDQLFFFFHGIGSNGKSLLASLIALALGDYSAPISSALVSKPNVDAQSASPALTALKSIRSGILTELEQKTLYTEFLKMLVCGDRTTGRDLYEKKMQVITLAVKPFIMLNKLPIVFDMTRGFWRKVVVIPCDARFESTIDPSKSNEKKIIVGFEKELLKCADTFLALLIEVYLNEYKSEGIRDDVQPEIIKQTTLEYQRSQNIAMSFEQSVLEKSEGHILTVNDVNASFRKFCKNAGILHSQHLVDQVHERLDSLSPPTNRTRQIKHHGKNLRGWANYRVVPKGDMDLAYATDEE